MRIAGVWWFNWQLSESRIKRIKGFRGLKHCTALVVERSGSGDGIFYHTHYPFAWSYQIGSRMSYSLSEWTIKHTRQIHLSRIKRQICDTNGFVVHKCNTNSFVGHKTGNMQYKWICYAQVQHKLVCRTRNAKYVQQSDLLVTDGQQIRLFLLLTERKILATNLFVANETGNMSRNQICYAQVQHKSVCCAQNDKYAPQNPFLNSSLTTNH